MLDSEAVGHRLGKDPVGGEEPYLHDVLAHFGHFGEEEEREHAGDDTERPDCGCAGFEEGRLSWKFYGKSTAGLKIHAFFEESESEKEERDCVCMCEKEEEEGASTSTTLFSAQFRANLAGFDN